MAKKNFTNITQKSRSYCDLRVYARGGYSWPSDMHTRRALEKIARKFGGFSTGSGYCFPTKERDFGFAFPSREKASKFAKEAVLSKLIKVKMCVSDVNLTWEYGDSSKVDYKKI